MNVIQVGGLCNWGSSKPDLDYKLPVAVVCSSIALSHSNHNILVSRVFYEEYAATILLVLLWQQTTVLSNCDGTYNVICVLHYPARGLHSTAKETITILESEFAHFSSTEGWIHSANVSMQLQNHIQNIWL